MQLISLFTKTSILIIHTPAYTINPLVKKYATKTKRKTYTSIYIYVTLYIYIHIHTYTKRATPLIRSSDTETSPRGKWITTKTTSGKTQHKRQLSFLRLKWGITYRRFRGYAHCYVQKRVARKRNK